MNEHQRASVLVEALPHMQEYNGQVLVIKYGGHAMGDHDAALSFARDIVLLKQSGVHPIIVHGGGPQIGKLLGRLGIKSEFRDGMRVTDQETGEVVEMVLSGLINKRVVSLINSVGGRAVGLSGADGGMVTAIPMISKDGSDLGFVGVPERVDGRVLNTLLNDGNIPVLAPLANGKDGHRYNINSDIFAGAIAGCIKARRLLFLTDVEGLLDDNGALIRSITTSDARGLVARGIVHGGMIPKLNTCVDALEMGVQSVTIMDGRVDHAVLIELYTDRGSGTMITK